jgi:alkanesulfonate monooxygenase SsuD/methylene tetrahydromethanopterin reductase-like flavin-dependent oxidoreductase (luciferase family)
MDTQACSYTSPGWAGTLYMSLFGAAYATATWRAQLGTADLPIYTHHRTAMAQMAATLDELAGGRLRLGIGVSHKVTVENMWGLRLERPVEAMRAYLTIVRS